MGCAKFVPIFCSLIALLLSNVGFTIATPDPYALASPTTASIVNNGAFVYNFSDFGNDVLTQSSPDLISANAPTMTIIATVSEVQATLCTNSAGHFHCVTTSTSVTSTITSYTISTTIVTPTPTSSESAGLPTLNNPISKPLNLIKRWLNSKSTTIFRLQNQRLPTMVIKPSKCPPGSRPKRIPCGVMWFFTSILALFPAMRAHDLRGHVRDGVFFASGILTVAKIVLNIANLSLGFAVCTVWFGLTWCSCFA